MPNDETEQDRLDMTHHLWGVRLNGELHLAPLPANPQRVMDIGTGTGIWAIDFADMYPSAEVTGVDLSPIQVCYSWAVGRVKWLTNAYSRAGCPRMSSSKSMISRMNGFGSRARSTISTREQWLVRSGTGRGCWISATSKFFFPHQELACENSETDIPPSALKPGGYLELQETDLNLFSDDGTDKFATYLSEYIQGVRRAGNLLSSRFDIAPELSSLVQAAGFEDVTERKIKQPLGAWAKQKKMKEMGQWTLVIMESGLEAYGLKIFTHVLGWDKKRFDEFLEKVKNDIRNRQYHTYSYSYVVYARKPLEDE